VLADGESFGTIPAMGEGVERERALAKAERERAAKERDLAEASSGDERAMHAEAALQLEEAAVLHDRLADIYERHDSEDAR
jgi:hypothetical protein